MRREPDIIAYAIGAEHAAQVAGSLWLTDKAIKVADEQEVS